MAASNWISLPAALYNSSSMFGFERASERTTGCSPPAGVCFHSSRRKSGGRVARGGAAPRPRAGSCAVAVEDSHDASRTTVGNSVEYRVMDVR